MTIIKVKLHETVDWYFPHTEYDSKVIYGLIRSRPSAKLQFDACQIDCKSIGFRF